MTFSILAADESLVGGAAASHSVAVGSRVLWVSPGAGIVATQATTRVEYGSEILELMSKGTSVDAAVARCASADPHAEVRQVAAVDRAGNHSQHNGVGCVPIVDCCAGHSVCAQGNMLLHHGVAAAMVSTYHSSRDGLVLALLAALDAGEAAGGDYRGTRSATLLVAGSHGTIADLRVDDHPSPVAELARVYSECLLQRSIVAAYNELLGLREPRTDISEVLLTQSSSSVEREADRWMWIGLSHAIRGRPAAAIAALRRAVSLRDSVALALSRLLEGGRLDNDTMRTVREGLTQG